MGQMLAVNPEKFTPSLLYFLSLPSLVSFFFLKARIWWKADVFHLHTLQMLWHISSAITAPHVLTASQGGLLLPSLALLCLWVGGGCYSELWFLVMHHFLLMLGCNRAKGLLFKKKSMLRQQLLDKLSLPPEINTNKSRLWCLHKA